MTVQEAVDLFISENCKPVPGALLRYADFWPRLEAWGQARNLLFGRTTVARLLPTYGRQKTGQCFLGNLAWKEDQVEPSVPFLLIAGQLRRSLLPA